MKLLFKIVYLLLFLLNSNIVLSQTIPLFEEKSFDDALIQSKIQNKPIALIFYANWCVHCNKMKNDTFKDEEVISFYRKNFICIGINAESVEGINLKKQFQNKFKVKSYPTFAFFDSDKNLLSSFNGELSKENFINEGKNILIPENQLPFVRNNFNADFSNTDTCLKYITMLRRAGLDATAVTQQYTNSKSILDLISELNWRVIANGINDIKADEIQFILQNKEAFSKVTSPSRVEKKLVYLVSDNLKPLVDVVDTLNYYRLKPIAESFKIRKVDSLLFRYDLIISENSSNWKNYKKVTENSVETFCWNDSKLLVEISTNFLNFITDNKELNKALNWSERALNLAESVDKYMLISKLYLKQKNYKNALEIAQKGRTVALNFGWKTNDIDLLISDIKKKK